MKITFYSFVIFIFSIMIIGCKPDNMEIEIYTSDIESASEGEVNEVPLKATFNMMGEDEENQLPKAKKIALKYLPTESTVEVVKGDYGQTMSIVSSIPIGTSSALKKYLKKNKRIAMIVFEKGTVTLKQTKLLSKLNEELSDINFMLGAKLPASNTAFRIVSDSKKKVNIGATAVFSEEKPYLHFSKDIKKRKSVVIVFKGGDESVYSQISPHIIVKFWIYNKVNMAKEMKQPQSKLRDNETVIYSTSAQTSGFFIMGEGGYFYVTNKRLFLEKIGTGDVRYSFDLNEIDDCRSGISVSWFLLWLLPLVLIGGLRIAKLYDKKGIAFKKISAGAAGFGSKKLITQINNALDNYQPEVEAKVEESTQSDESPEDKLKKLTELKDKDLITEEDYNVKKEEILKNM